MPANAVKVQLRSKVNCNVRLIDCVGYLVEGAAGHEEGGVPRLVKTPWSEEEMPFEKAAEIGTQKVIRDHSTIGVLVTTDGTITDLPRANYVSAEERVVRELKEIRKPVYRRPEHQDAGGKGDGRPEKFPRKEIRRARARRQRGGTGIPRASPGSWKRCSSSSPCSPSISNSPNGGRRFPPILP